MISPRWTQGLLKSDGHQAQIFSAGKGIGVIGGDQGLGLVKILVRPGNTFCRASLNVGLPSYIDQRV